MPSVNNIAASNSWPDEGVRPALPVTAHTHPVVVDLPRPAPLSMRTCWWHMDRRAAQRVLMVLFVVALLIFIMGRLGVFGGVASPGGVSAMVVSAAVTLCVIGVYREMQ